MKFYQKIGKLNSSIPLARVSSAIDALRDAQKTILFP